jgi:hypothetical protein
MSKKPAPLIAALIAAVKSNVILNIIADGKRGGKCIAIPERSLTN